MPAWGCYLNLIIQAPGSGGVRAVEHGQLGARSPAGGRAREQVAALVAGDDSLRDPTPTVEKIFGAYLAHKTPTKSLGEQKADRRRVRMWMNFLGRKFDLSKLTLQKWMQFITARKSGAIDAQGRPRG